MSEIIDIDLELTEIDLDGAAYIVPVGENFRKIKAAAEALKAGVESSSDADHTHTAEEVGAAPEEHSHTAKDVGAAPAEHYHTTKEVGAFPAAQGETLQESVGNISAKLFSHCWKKKKLEQLIEVDITKVDLYLGYADSASTNFTIYYADSFSSTVNSDGSVTCTLSNPQAVTISYNNYTDAIVLRGKYVVTNDGDTDTCWYIDEASEITTKTQNTSYYVVFDAYKASIDEQYLELGYVFSNSADTYSQGQNNDGYYYEYLGVPFENSVNSTRIEFGSYDGTGTWGEDYPCSITFNRAPKYVHLIAMEYIDDGRFVYFDYYSTVYTEILWNALESNAYMNASGFIWTHTGTVSLTKDSFRAKKEGNTMSWYLVSSANADCSEYQFNKAGCRYHYMVIY